ncbi:hypothetical protein JRQ81_018675, partial [Phrynocephalus forsythii]
REGGQNVQLASGQRSPLQFRKRTPRKPLPMCRKRVTRSARKRHKEGYSIYVYKLWKQVHPDTGISSKAMSIMHLLVNDILEHIMAEASPPGPLQQALYHHITGDSDSRPPPDAWGAGQACCL